MTSKEYAPAKKVAAAAKAPAKKVAAAAKASLPFDLPKFELPKFDLPKFELPKVDVLNLNFSAMATSARTRVETTTTDVRNSVNHGVTLLREVVGV